MKKAFQTKRLWLVIVTIIAAMACMLCFVACGGDGGNGDGEGTIERGERVTESEWKAAFRATAEATNYTYDYTEINEYGRAPTTTQVDLESDYVLYHKGSRDPKEDDITPYFPEFFFVVNDTEFWEIYDEKGTGRVHADFVKYESKEAAREAALKRANSLRASSWYEGYTYEGLEFSGYLYALEESAIEQFELGELYHQFTFDDELGIYSATLCRVNYWDGKVNFITKMDIEISIKNGYIIRVDLKSDEDEYELIVREYGSTVVTPSARTLEAYNKARQNL